jgi:hypothetical protein
MNNLRISLPVIFILFFWHFVAGQSPAHIEGEFLVALMPGATPAALVQHLEFETGKKGLVSCRPISRSMNTWRFQLDTTFHLSALPLDWFQRQAAVQMAQWNFRWLPRNDASCDNILPNDPLEAMQWQYVNTGANGGLFDADLDADQAWDITTGGITPAGDTIVVAVIDGGIQYSHPDLAPNLWHNWAEIPNDGIDNDENGFTDDFRGWNTVTENDDIEGSGTVHGTPVSAIIGAKGNNGIGVSGVNWNVKMMFVAGGNTLADILEAFDYVREARLRYNSTHGASGAFVVALNCSWGINNGHPADAPLWCAALDSLGLAGIITVGATANSPVNVDEVGDLPTTCPSDYLIAVTSLGKADHKAASAAWGPANIDLGAYGDGVFTAGAASSYGPYAGTSFAAPHVSGAVALLYAAPCPGLIALAKTQPAAAALWAKNLIIDQVTPIPELHNITLSGGRLNLFNTLQAYQDQCSPCPPPFALVAKNIKQTSAQLIWVGVSDFEFVKIRWRKQGDPSWTEINHALSPYTIDNLTPCTTYEFQAIAFCNQGLFSAWSEPFAFKTDGCCVPPIHLTAAEIYDTQVKVTWQPVAAATKYTVRFRKPGSSAWLAQVVTDTLIELTGLTPCSYYEIQVRSTCSNTGTTNFSNSLFFTTSGCGACLDFSYCQATGTTALSEWVGLFKLDTFTLVKSVQPGNAYQNFTGIQSVTVTATAGESYPVMVRPGFSATPRKEYFRVYIDTNGDGFFSWDEVLFDPGFSSADLQTGTLKIPDNAAPGLTRMRLLMKFTNDPAQAPTPCEVFNFGQVQDFCINIRAGATPSSQPSDNTPQLRIFPNPAAEMVVIELPVKGGGQNTIQIWGTDGTIRYMNQTQLPLKINVSDWPSGVYFLQLRDSYGTGFLGMFVKQ